MNNTINKYMSWCFANDIKIYPIRLQMPLERYKVGIQINNKPEQVGAQIYTNETTKNTVGVYDKIKDLYKHFYTKNNTNQ
jgi:hypothetical protein